MTASENEVQDTELTEEETLKQIKQCSGLSPPSRCECLLRLTKCLVLYQSVIDAQGIDVLLEYFNQQYPRSLLQEDWTHVLLEHFGDARTIAESQQQHEQIYDHLMNLEVLKDCELERCRAFTRNNRDRENEKANKLKLGDIDGNDADLLSFYVDEMDTIHCHLLHSFDCGFRTRASDMLSIQQQQEEELKDDDENDDGTMPLVHNEALEKLITLTQSARKRMARLRGANGKKHSKFVTEIGGTSTGHDNKDNETDNEQTEVKDAEQDEEKDTNHATAEELPKYDPGMPFEYDDETNAYYQRAKYDNLQQELMSNQNYTIPLYVFKQLAHKANEKMTLAVAKELKYQGDDEDNEKNGQPITVEHLLVVLLYCNISALCYEFSKTFRPIDDDTCWEDVAARNLEYCIWSRLLSEAVNGYGVEIGDTKPTTFYHGINKRMVFRAGFVPFFDSPTSLTVQLHVATTFATDNGIILVLKKERKSLRYFNCSWLSCFPNEDERLVMGWGSKTSTPKTLKVDSIKCMRTASDYREYLHALSWFNRCIIGYPQSPDQDYKTSKARKKDGRLIAAMIKHFDPEIDFENGCPEYVNALFDAWRTEIPLIWINIPNIKRPFTRVCSKYVHMVMAYEARAFLLM